MNTPLRTLTCLAVSSFILTPLSIADDEKASDWPHWRGPDSTGVSPETGWSAAGREASLWSKHIGFGHSSFAVADGRLYAMGYDVDRKLDQVHCLDPATGEELWTHTYPAEYWNEGHDGGTCTTPTVDGETVYTSNREGKLFALRADSGSVIWSRDMQEELSVTPPRWGFAGSPVIIDDMLVANVGKLAAYDKSTGDFKWVSEKSYGDAYSTPIEYDWRGRPAVLVLNGLGLAAIDQSDGSEIAFFSWSRNPQQSIYGATPVVIDNRVFISATSGGGCVMLQPTEDDEFDVVWESRVMRNDHAGSVLYEDHLYGFDSSILKCIDLDGNETWRKRGIGLGAVVVVGGRLLIIGAKGELIVAEASPEAYVELSRAKVLQGGAYWSTPVLSNGLAYARNSLGDMVCRDYRASSAVATTRTEIPAEMPAAASLFAGHLAAVGGADALRALTSVHLRGQGETHGMGPIERCDAELSWSADGAFVWRFASGLDFGYNPELGWNLSMMGPRILEDAQIVEMREIGDLRRVLGASWGYAAAETTDARVFDDRLCYAVDCELESGDQRTLYFEVETGFLAGQEGDDVPLWIFDRYEKVGGALIPMEWSFYTAESGAMTAARFSDASANEIDQAALEPPLVIAMMTWTDEQKEKANAELRPRYDWLVGSYKLATGGMAGTPITIDIDEGGIRMALAINPPDFLTEPDEEGRMYTMSNRQIYLAIRHDEAGGEPVITLWAYGDEFGRLERADD